MKTYVVNFGIEKNGGSQLVMPMVYGGITESQLSLFGKCYLTDYFVSSKGVHEIKGCFLKNELNTMIDATIQCILLEPDKIRKLHQETYAWNDEYFAFAAYTLTVEKKLLSDSQLAHMYGKLINLQQISHMHAVTTTWFVDTEDSKFSKLLLKKTKQLAEKEFAKVFSVLTSDVRNSLTLQEEIEFLRLVKFCQQPILRKNLSKASSEDELPTSIQLRIKGHHKKWCWLPFMYMGPPYSREHYLTQLKQKLEDNTIEKQIASLENRPVELEEEKKKIVQRLHLDKATLDLYKIAADMIFLKNYRKEAMFHGSYALSLILKETAKRKQVALNHLYMLSPAEITQILIGILDISIVEQRMQATVIRFKDNVVQLLEGKKALEFLRTHAPTETIVDLDQKVLQGVCSSSGKASGIVRIINSTNDMDKMQQGDIMVSHTTFPSLVPAMKKAAAIITEDGGMTCHAAIVSRELGTPCITGIKKAAKILKDGDRVEVDADQGKVTRK